MSNKRTFNEDSSEEDTNNPLPAKKAATSSPASEQSGTRVPKGRGGGDLAKISANTLEDRGPVREISLQHGLPGRNRSTINRHSPLKPPGTINTATKHKTKSKEKNTPS